MEAAGDAYVATDLAGVVLDGNRAAEALFGYGREELLGSTLVDLVVPESQRGDFLALRRQLIAHGGTEQPVALTFAVRGGGEVQVEASVWITEHDGASWIHALYRDVTERVRLQQQLAVQTRRLEEAQALAGVGSWEWDVVNDVVTWSAELHRITGLDVQTPPGYSTFVDLLHPEDRPWVEARVEAAVAHSQTLDYEARLVRPDGDVRWIAGHGDTVTDEHGDVIRLLGAVHDITDRKVTELELERLAVTDAMTGLATRSLFGERLGAALDDRARSARPSSLLLLDLDGFKPVNDMHGHPVGDAVLIEVARRLEECTRPVDTLARLGGDEFALLIPGAELADAERVAQRLIDVVSEPIVVSEAGDETAIAIGASVGIAVSAEPSATAAQLRREADQALYVAKRRGRGRYSVFVDGDERTGAGTLTVWPADARAWADGMRALRAEIAERKEQGGLPAASTAPASVLRTLQLLLAAIDQLPQQRQAGLVLPERGQLEEFVFHQRMVNDWTDGLVRDGVLTTVPSRGSRRFWSVLEDAVAGSGQGGGRHRDPSASAPSDRPDPA